MPHYHSGLASGRASNHKICHISIFEMTKKVFKPLTLIRIKTFQSEDVAHNRSTGWSTKMSLFFFGNDFYKNRETFKIFSPQIQEVYRILLVGTTLESIMFYYTFSVSNSIFVSCTTLLYDSTAASRTLKLPATLLSISCAIRLISFVMMSSLVCGLFSQILSFSYSFRKQSSRLRFWNSIAKGYWFDVK